MGEANVSTEFMLSCFLLCLIRDYPTQDAEGNYSCVELKHASKIIGTTAEEVVMKAREGADIS